MSEPMDLRSIQVTDQFWKQEMELVRREVIPYQWKALNDQIPDAAKSYCMRNFKIAGRMNRARKEKPESYVAPSYTFRGFEALPEDPENPDPDKFYGFVFQDTDFSKWIEAVAYSLTQHPDPELEALADGAIDIVCEAQQEDGYLDTYYIINGRDKTWSNLKDHHELYCFGHLTEGAVAYYQATGKKKLLHAAMRFADYVDSYFGPEPEKCKGYPGHEIAEMALVRLYDVTGDRKYLELSRYFIEQRGQQPLYFAQEHADEIRKDQKKEILPYSYNQAHLPVRQQTQATGHSVRAVYLYSGMADIARKFRDDSMFEACHTLWEDVTKRKMYITGGVGSTHLGEAFTYGYDLPNDTAYAETCASIGMVFWGRRMLQMVPDSAYADVCERELYNGILSGMALDGKSFFYVNPLEVYPEANHWDERKFHVKPVRQKWFGCACCPPNLARLISSIASYAFTENADTLWIHQYLGAELKKKVGEKELKITLESGFPWNGKTSVTVSGQGVEATLALRIPGWAEHYTIKGVEDAEQRVEKGYLYVTKTWTGREVLMLDFEMKVCLTGAKASVREDSNKAAYEYGPLVYCLESKDNGENLQNLLLNPMAEAKLIDFSIGTASARAIQVSGYRKVVEETDDQLYQNWRKPVLEETDLTLIPYYMWANRGENEMQVWTPVMLF